MVPSAYSVLDDIVSWNGERRRRGEKLAPALAGLRGRRAELPTRAVRDNAAG